MKPKSEILAGPGQVIVIYVCSNICWGKVGNCTTVFIYVLGDHQDINGIRILGCIDYIEASILNESQTTEISFIFHHFISIDGIVFPEEKSLLNHPLSGLKMKIVSQSDQFHGSSGGSVIDLGAEYI